jgi:hypothetical protein
MVLFDDTLPREKLASAHCLVVPPKLKETLRV